MNFREEYRKYNEAIRPDKAMVEGMLEEAREQQETRRKEKYRVLRDVMTAAAVCVCIFVGIPVVAANVEPIYDLMYRISPRLAQSFCLVQKSDEDQGIRMEVLSAYIHENEIQAYITLQDLEEDRIDETTDLYDSYTIRIPFDGYGGGGSQPVDFDDKTGIATFLVTLGTFSGENESLKEVVGKKVTFSLRELIGKKTEYDDLEIPVLWSEVEMEPQTVSPKLRGGSYPNMAWGDDDDPRPSGKMLLPGKAEEIVPVEGIMLTGMGYIDGMLHIQTMVPNLLETDNHCELFLVDGEGNRRLCDYKINAFGSTAETKGTDYQDCIFVISPEELENYTLHGHFVTSGFHIKGNWSVTFPIE